MHFMNWQLPVFVFFPLAVSRVLHCGNHSCDGDKMSSLRGRHFNFSDKCLLWHFLLVPGGIAPESLTFTPLDDMIFLKWEEPVEPNGLITQYEVISQHVGFKLEASFLTWLPTEVEPAPESPDYLYLCLH